MSSAKGHDEFDRSYPLNGIYFIGLVGPREVCRGCGNPRKPAGFRNFCPACGKYPAEILAEQANRDDGE